MMSRSVTGSGSLLKNCREWKRTLELVYSRWQKPCTNGLEPKRKTTGLFSETCKVRT